MKRSTALLCTTTLLAGVAATVTAGSASAAPGPDEHRRDAVHRADQSIAGHRDAVAAGPDEGFVVRDVVLDASGAEHVRYDRTYRGLPVLGGDVVVHGTGSGRLTGVDKTQGRPLSLGTTPSVSREQAVATARRTADGTVDGNGDPQLVVLERTATPRLAYDVLVTGTTSAGDPSELHVVVDALDGRVLDREQGIETAKPVKPAPSPSPTSTTPAATYTVSLGNQSLYLGAVPLTITPISGGYSLKDQTRGGATTSDLRGLTSGTGTLFTDVDGVFGTGVKADPQTAAVDAHYGVAETWDYYRATFGRNGIANDGKGAPSRVHYGRSYNNAFWSDSCFCMTFGDGDGRQFNPLVSLDVAGHEMSHGVTSRTANLTYSAESGGLNEANSDIFGTRVEWRAAQAEAGPKGLAPTDKTLSDPADYTIGEEVVPLGAKPLRFMTKPSLDGTSPDCWYDGIGNLNVHYSSGVGNRLFFLLAEGSGTTAFGPQAALCGSAGAVTGVGQQDAEQIWYRALTLHMTSSTNYAGARIATVTAATELFGATSTQVAQVKAAWAAVGVTGDAPATGGK